MQSLKKGTSHGAVELKQGRLQIAGKPVFLKIGKPLRNYADPAEADKLISELDILRGKGYNALELCCYWHHFDIDGDGTIDVSLEPVNRVIAEIAKRGMFPCLGVETYAVGGGIVPAPFFQRHPDAQAINERGEKAIDTEYGFMHTIPSQFSPEYLKAARDYVRNLARGVDTGKILWFETSVEPQYIGNQWLDCGPYGRRAYAEWLAQNKLDGPPMPEGFPVPDSFLKDPAWNRFRAEKLAEWVNGEAAAWREVAGPGALVAVDYLETCGPDMTARLGDPLTWLRGLDSANIIQVNWTWNLVTRQPNHGAYKNVRAVMQETGRDWAITEHMTINGSDFKEEEMEALLRNTLAQGTRFGWEFVNIGANSKDSFCVYNDDWSPKPTMAAIDNRWESWMKEVETAETTPAKAWRGAFGLSF